MKAVKLSYVCPAHKDQFFLYMSTVYPSSVQPLAFEVINPNGRAPMLLTCDHASNRIPEELAGLGISRALQSAHIAYDIGAKQVAIHLSHEFDAPLILGMYSRLVVDLNRFPDDPSIIPASSDHHPIPGNQALDEAQRQQRMQRFFYPYHQCHEELVDQLIENHDDPMIFSVHSFTPKMDEFDRPWHYGVLWDKCENLAKELCHALGRNPSLCIGENQPYSAVSPKGYSMNVHAQDRGVDMGLIEIRQDLIGDGPGQTEAAAIISKALRHIRPGLN